MLHEGIDLAYGYRPLHTQSGLGHAFANSILYLDFDRRGFDYPVLPFTVNSYGRMLVGTKGVPPTPTTAAQLFEAGELDPPGPQPWRCFQVGQAIARAMQKSPWRVALVASSSWSHGFLTVKNGVMFPDVAADRKYFDALCAGDWETWRSTSIEEAEDSGHHELLNWFMLAGAMSELGRKPNEATFLETWICNSDKVFAVFRP